MANNRKKKRAATAGAITLVAALVLTGTYAWRSISQEALNENLVLANPGGRLHDDWNGSKKKVYVENFTDTTYNPNYDGVNDTNKTIVNPNQAPIYVRVRLQEYLELGKDAGKNFDDPDRKATPLIPTMDFNDKSTWTLYQPGNGSDLFQEYVEVKTTENTALKYMPTFNKNQESLKADINGTYEGTTTGDKVHFDDYVDYELAANQNNKQDDAYYYLEDKGNAANPSVKPGDETDHYKNEGEDHAVKETLTTAKIYSMTEWLALPDTDKVGNYWVYDEDGWAYWAQPLDPGTATGPLITDVTLKKTAGGNCYYAINVVGEFADEGDWGDPEGGDKETLGFYYNGLTQNGLKLLNTISGASTDADHISITAEAGDIKGSSATDSISVEPGTTINFSGVVTAKGKEVADQGLTWSVGNSRAISSTDLNQSGNNATLTVGATETAQTVWVKATSTANGSLVASYKVTVLPPTSVKVTMDTTQAADDLGKVAPNGTLTYKAEVRAAKSKKYANQNVTWSVTGGNGTSTCNNGVLTVGSTEVAGTILTIKAASDTDNDVVGTATIRVSTSKLPVATLNTIDEVKVTADGVLAGNKTGADGSVLGNANNTKTVTIDGVDFYVVAKKDGKALLLAKEKLEEKAFGGADWENSTLRAYLNDDTASTGWLDGKAALKAAALETEIVSNTDTDQIFLLTKDDIYGGTDLTAGKQLVAPNGSWVANWSSSTTKWWSLRTVDSSSNEVDVVSSTGESATEKDDAARGGVRPACWISL